MISRTNLIILVLGIAIGAMVNGWRLGERIVEIERDAARAETAAVLGAAIETANLMKQVEDARNEATRREQALRRDAAELRDANGGLRTELDEIRRALPDMATGACRERVDTLAKLFGSCAARYGEVAERADRHASDVKTLEDAWPK